ncbi:MAG TPA: hypothetical protein VEI02_12030 [Planctomycetota bacterium]|nr:hypothetical protein [Planctomycetota bacterium]
MKAAHDDGPATTFTAAGMLLLAVALVATRLVPARAKAADVRSDEASLALRLRDAENERRRLEAVERGLESGDPRVLERLLRADGVGQNGEVRLVSDSRPAGPLAPR